MMTTEEMRDTFLVAWVETFPDAPYPDWKQLRDWISVHGLAKTLTAFRVAVRKHLEYTAVGKPMTLNRFCTYMTGVLDNMRAYTTMPIPTCPNCGEPMSMDGRCPKAKENDYRGIK